jgi:hypothetical protein
VLRESARQISELKTAYDAAMNDARAMQREVAYRARIVVVQREMQQLGSQTLENLFTHEHDLLDAKTRLHEARARAAIAWSAAQVLNGMPAAVYISKMDTP